MSRPADGTHEPASGLREALAALVKAEDAGIAVWQAVKDCGHPAGEWCAEMQHVIDTSDARDAATKVAFEQARAALAAPAGNADAAQHIYDIDHMSEDDD